jgi:predicted SAM-dependent methyltransferase
MVEIARTARAGLLDIKRIQGVAARGRKIRNYLGNNHPKKLQLGTSNSPLAGWLNTDLLTTSRKIAYLDATRRFPFHDDTFDYVYSEHMIEHIDHESALFMLRECFRVLKPAGKIRISTPDLKVYTGLLSKEKTASQNHYIDWVIHRFMPGVDYCKEVFVINNAFRAWGHQFLYDRETIRIMMTRIGFDDIQYYQPGVSNDENLRGIESHGSLIQCEEVNQFETFAVEGQIPNPKTRI